MHHSALRICTGAFRTSPILSLYADTWEPPLHIIRDKISVSLYFRILSHPNHPVHHQLNNRDHDRLFANRPSCISSYGLRMHSLVIGTSLANCNVHVRSLFSTAPWQDPDIFILTPFSGFNKHSTSDHMFQQLFACHRDEYKDNIDIYTDGSKTPDGVGCGYVCRDASFSYSLPALCSTFTAEIIAIKQALQYIKSQQYKKFIIYTDCNSVLDSLSTRNPVNSLICTIINMHKLISSYGYSILFCWVPGHVGIRGNELADIAARRALVHLSHEIPISDMKLEIEKLCLQKLQLLWDNQISNKLHKIKKKQSQFGQVCTNVAWMYL